MRRVRFLAMAAALLAMPAGLVMASDFGEQAVYVEGYLDEAPANANPLETVEITRDGKNRVLVVVTAHSADRPGVAFGNGAAEMPLQVKGQKEQVSQIMGAREGAKVRAKVKYYPASRSILVQDVDS